MQCQRTVGNYEYMSLKVTKQSQYTTGIRWKKWKTERFHHSAFYFSEIVDVRSFYNQLWYIVHIFNHPCANIDTAEVGSCRLIRWCSYKRITCTLCQFPEDLHLGSTWKRSILSQSNTNVVGWQVFCTKRKLQGSCWHNQFRTASYKQTTPS